jgi:DNA-binding response OmpR family regulator
MARILIADDQPDLLSILASRFRALGFDVAEAKNGAEALKKAREGDVDLLILDVMMPELNGFQVCRHLKEDAKHSAVPIIMLTAKDSEADRFWGTEVGADLYLTKPIDPGQVVLHAQELLETTE